VVLSLHWGVHFIRARIADYQPEVAHAAIDAGADAVVGHHPHILKGVELYRGKPVLYSIGNFAFDFPERAGDDEYNERRQRVYDALVPTTEQRFQDDATYSTIVNLFVEGGDVRETTLTPVWITDEAQPVPVSPSSERGTEIVDYLRSVTAEAELQTEYTVRDETVSVTP
jgi:poly-gamma-glutamate synthesis protein (capsule biosynthesis protein)